MSIFRQELYPPSLCRHPSAHHETSDAHHERDASGPDELRGQLRGQEVPLFVIASKDELGECQGSLRRGGNER